MGSFQPFPPVQTWPQVAQRKGPCTDFAKRLKAKSFKICSGLNKKKCPFKETKTTLGIIVWEPPTVLRVPNLILPIFHV